MSILNSFLLLLRWLKEEKTKQRMDFTQLFIYFIYCYKVKKYRFCISVIGYINVQIIGIGYKKSISVDH